MLQFTKGNILGNKPFTNVATLVKGFFSKSPPIVNCNIQRYAPKGAKPSFPKWQISKGALATLVNCENSQPPRFLPNFTNQ